MSHVTRDVDPAEVLDLLARAPRACLSFATGGAPQVVPVEFVLRGGRYLVGIEANHASVPVAGQEVVLLVDEGVHWFDLRAIYLRGTVQPAPGPDDAPGGRAWLEVQPVKCIAWDYGRLREVSDADR